MSWISALFMAVLAVLAQGCVGSGAAEGGGGGSGAGGGNATVDGGTIDEGGTVLIDSSSLVDAGCFLDDGGPCPEQIDAGPICGDLMINQPGEICDDGNRVPGDGCSPACQPEPLFVCPPEGGPCTPLMVCGDRELTGIEQCDDGNAQDGDGCSHNCYLEAAYWDCSVVGVPCVNTVQCGDGEREAAETCDDGNPTGGDGCSETCQIEPGWSCRRPGAACVPDCGDGTIMQGAEECDDGNTNSGDGCSVSCRVEPSYSCTGEPSVCTSSTCGDGIMEGAEQCDEGETDTDGNGLVNGLFYGDGTGCTKTCTHEPNCAPADSDDPCISACGDGIKTEAEACDDGNLAPYDGCSPDCQVEDGFTCEVQAQSDVEDCSSGPCLVLPMTYRDFKSQNEPSGHKDFFFMGSANGIGGKTHCVPNASCGTGSGNQCEDDRTEMCTGLAQERVDAEGKPVFNASRPGGNQCDCRYKDWDDTGVLSGFATSNEDGHDVFEGMVPVVESATSFSQWYRDVPGTNATVRGMLELEAIGGGQYRFSSSDGRTIQDDIDDEVPLDSGFFPLEDELFSASLCNLWPYWIDWPGCSGTQWSPVADGRDGEDQVEANGRDRNFYFTSEARYLFYYRTGMTASLDFFGDDDVFVFINGHLALDLGGTHEQLQGDVDIGPTTEGQFALSPGNIYEIEVFHADRHPRDSNYQLTLQGFETDLSVCAPTCGDAVATIMEECDYGPAGCAQGELCNDGQYASCNEDCTFASFCGDGIPDEGFEECDDGFNTTTAYGVEGCAPGCLNPPRCGDAQVDPQEECDDGDGMNQDGVPGACSTLCTINPRCGDGVMMPEAGEECDMGDMNEPPGNVSYGGCSTDCLLGPHCGDGVLDEGQEYCDDGNLEDYDGCSAVCVPEYVPE